VDGEQTVEVVVTPTQRAYILATPLQEPAEACLIAFHARTGSSGDFAIFARQNKRLFERKRNYADTMFLYRLSKEGSDLRQRIETERDALTPSPKENG
jgi:hypothetical protein